MRAMAVRSDPALDRARLVDAAFALLEANGLDALTMRRLAARLGVQAPALYWHVADKAELMGMMAARIYAAAYAGAGAGAGDAADPGGWLIGFGTALRASFTAHRDGARLCAGARPTRQADPEAHAATITAPLVALGLTRERALVCQATVISYTLGWTLFEANGPMRDHLAQMMAFPASFATGLEALVAGLVRA